MPNDNDFSYVINRAVELRKQGAKAGLPLELIAALVLGDSIRCSLEQHATNLHNSLNEQVNSLVLAVRP